MTTQATVQRTHQKAVRFFWGLLFTATAVSLIDNVAHALLSPIPKYSSRSALPQCLRLPFLHPCMESPSRCERERPEPSTDAPSVPSSLAWARSP